MKIGSPKILKVDAGGFPQEWISYKAAASLLCAEEYEWTYGENVKRMYGGINQFTRQQSYIDIPAVIAVKSQHHLDLNSFVPHLGRCGNYRLFARDRHICAYCGQKFKPKELTRDHVKPTSHGGKDIWSNVVAACFRCNSRKSNKTPEQANMPLLYIPYTPNWFEDFILRQSGRKILADQMAFLESKLPSYSRVKPN